MVKKAKETNEAPAQIFAVTVQNNPQNVLSEFPREECLKRTIRKQKPKNVQKSKPSCARQ